VLPGLKSIISRVECRRDPFYSACGISWPRRSKNRRCHGVVLGETVDREGAFQLPGLGPTSGFIFLFIRVLFSSLLPSSFSDLRLTSLSTSTPLLPPVCHSYPFPLFSGAFINLFRLSPLSVTISLLTLSRDSFQRLVVKTSLIRACSSDRYLD
jgi:hypothetical protein